MTTMATDDAQEDFCLDLQEFAKKLGIKKTAADSPAKPVGVRFKYDPVEGKYVPEDYEPLKAMPRTTVSPDPLALQKALKKLENSELIDLYSERMQQAEKGQTESLRGAELESADSLKKAVENPDIIDLYRERILKKRR